MAAFPSIRLAILVGALALSTSSLEAQAAPATIRYKVIVHPSNQVKSLSRKQLAAMFLKKQDSWESGALVIPVDQPERAAVRQTFSREVLGKPPAAVKSYWNQLVFSGRNVPPAERTTDDDVVNFVKNTPSAVGYVSATTKTKGVRVVMVGS
jgi:ABC-type phosphate transport system substrate-binding protein